MVPTSGAVDVNQMQITGTEGSAGSYGVVTFGNGLQLYVDMSTGPTTDAGTSNPVFDRGNSIRPPPTALMLVRVVA
jgi:hypothetical protein